MYLHYLSRRGALAAVLAIGFLGCGPAKTNLKPVTGKVTYQARPLSAAQVIFMPIEATPGVGGQARTDAQGNYRVNYSQGGVGLLPGKYKITVSQLLMPDGSPGPEGVSPIESPAQETLPPHYSLEASTRLTKEVPATGGVIDLILD